LSPGRPLDVLVTGSARRAATMTLRYFDVWVELAGHDAAVAGWVRESSGVVWSHRCRWADLAETLDGLEGVRDALDLDRDWTRRWAATWRYAGDEVVSPVRDLGSMPVAGCEPMRRFSWRRGQRHRPGLQFLVSTGRHHGFESLEEARLLLALDFAGDLVEVVGQPFRLRYGAGGGWRSHVPDFLADTVTGRWLIDVRPGSRVGAEDLVAFAASAEAALTAGWRYAVVTGWRAHVVATLDTLSAQRRTLTDRLGLVDGLLAGVAAGPRPLRELVEDTVAPAVARAFLLHLVWHRRLGVDLGGPLGDRTLVCSGQDGSW